MYSSCPMDQAISAHRYRSTKVSGPRAVKRAKARLANGTSATLECSSRKGGSRKARKAILSSTQEPALTCLLALVAEVASVSLAAQTCYSQDICLLALIRLDYTGRKLASLELKIIFALVCWNYELQQTPPELSGFEAADKITHQPQHVYVRLAKAKC